VHIEKPEGIGLLLTPCGQDITGALNNLGSAVSAANIAFGHVRSSSDVIHAAITYAAFRE
jgi:hypothetical protein